MENPLTPGTKNDVIEDALQSYPLASMPRDIRGEVMSRIQTIPMPRPLGLTWNDVVLSIVLSLCIGAAWFSVQNLPPLVVAQIRKESILLYQYVLVNARWLIPILSFSVGGFLLTLTIPYLKQELTRKSV
ncbi:MAG TPA: hypothetical protein VJ821_04005 [Anaerolineales bacterium]|nr:hypothetical protein [Anaerolineales bacterium]